MKIKLITIGTRMPAWVTSGYHDYQKRLPREIALELIEISMPKRQKNADIKQLIAKEGLLMLDQLSRDDTVIALDEHGQQWTTRELSKQLQSWLQQGSDICLLIGGPDGLAPACKERASSLWSLSTLTLPHPLIRPILAEQLYRAWSIMHNHPYHRE